MPRTHYKLIRHMGRDTTLSELSRETGITKGCLQARYQAGDRGEHLVRPARVVAAGGGWSKPMDLSPRDDSHARRIALWVSRVAPWAMGGEA